MTDPAPQHLPHSWKEVPPFAYARTAVLCAALWLLSDSSAFCHLGFILRCLRQGHLFLDAAVVALKR